MSYKAVFYIQCFGLLIACIDNKADISLFLAIKNKI